MNCERSLRLLGYLAENTLDQQTAERVTDHLVSCQNCEAEFENLFNGKEIYKDFLFEIEPPDNLPARFQARLEIEDRHQMAAAKSFFGFDKKLSGPLAAFRLKATLVTVSILILAALGLVFFNFTDDPEMAENTRSSPAISEPLPTNLPQMKAAETPKTAQPISSGNLKKTALARIQREIPKESSRLIPISHPALKKAPPKRESPAKVIKLSAEEQNQVAQIQELEIDTARQIEKIELLFRAFRNARSIEATGQYDVAYEKQQARKLLRSNLELKQRVERYGSFLTEEMLNKVEPYLLDIANLDSAPTARQVSRIKDRFRDQNIITDLQGF